MSNVKAFIAYIAKTLLILVGLSFAFQPSLAQANTTQVHVTSFDTPLIPLTNVALMTLLVVPVNAEDKEPDQSTRKIEESLQPTFVTELSGLEIAISKVLKKYAHVSVVEATLVVNYVFHYAARYNIRPALLLGIISAESSFKRKAVSSHGAIGYYQVMPRYHRSKINGRNVMDTAVNIQVGTMILNDCFKRAGTEYRALACYNGATKPKDIASYTRHISKHVNFFTET